jgi:DNA (cytosine-5)-methyltransferase 1
MTSGAYYNEHDPQKAAWLRELIKAGLVAPGTVDERSIADVQPADLVGFTQCHFFAGIGVWSYAFRLARWPDDRPAWTASTPCPSFSAAGKGLGFNDPRHLWPELFRLTRVCRPRVLFGEQVAAAIGHGWLDLVCGDLEAEGYAVAPAVLGAHSAGAPHIRQRLYFCAHANSRGQESGSLDGQSFTRSSGCEDGITYNKSTSSIVCKSGNGSDTKHLRFDEEKCRDLRGQEGARSTYRDEPHRSRGTVLSGQSIGTRLEGLSGDVREWRGPGWLDPVTARSIAAAGATRGFWADCDWWYGRDEKYRPIGPGLQPLAHGAPARVVRLRGYGDAICAPTAQAFIEAAMEVIS